MKTIRWGIIGCGAVTERKSGPAFRRADRSELVAVMRRDAALARDYAIRHNVPRWYDNADELIADPSVDAVYIATPPAFHCEYTLKCARAGKPVYVEKPMALNDAQCREMNEACSRAGIPLFVAYYRRRLPKFMKIKSLLGQGAIGEIRFVHIWHAHKPQPPTDDPILPWRFQPELSGGGLFVDLASHTLDLFDDLLGPIVDVAGGSANQSGMYPVEDIVSARFLFACGIHGTGVWSFACGGGSEERNEIFGSKGKLSFSTFGPELELTTEDGVCKSVVYEDDPPHVQQPLIQSIVDELNGMGVCPSTGISAARTTKVMDAMRRGGDTALCLFSNSKVYE